MPNCHGPRCRCPIAALLVLTWEVVDKSNKETRLNISNFLPILIANFYCTGRLAGPAAVVQSSHKIIRIRRKVKLHLLGQEPWSSGFGRRLISWRSWVQIPAQYTGWTFFTYICCKNCSVCLKRRKYMKKMPGWPIFKNVQFKFCRWMQSNFGLLVLEATAYPFEPQPLPTATKYVLKEEDQKWPNQSSTKICQFEVD